MTGADDDDPFATTHIVSGVVIEKDGKYLLVQERQPKAHGLWNLPAGRVDKGDTLEQTAVREAKEETGYDVELGRHLLVIHETVERPVKHAFAAKIIGGELNLPDHEIMDARWFTYDEILAMDSQLRNAGYVLGAIERTREL